MKLTNVQIEGVYLAISDVNANAKTPALLAYKLARIMLEITPHFQAVSKAKQALAKKFAPDTGILIPAMECYEAAMKEISPILEEEIQFSFALLEPEDLEAIEGNVKVSSMVSLFDVTTAEAVVAEVQSEPDNKPASS